MKVLHALARLVPALGIVTACLAADAPSDVDSSKALLDAILKARGDVETATAELSCIRDAVSAERLPLARKVEALETEVRKLREEARAVRRAATAGDKEHRALVAGVASLEEECSFAHSLLSEYRRSLETRAGRAEHQLFAESLAAVDGALGADDKHARLPEALKHILDLAGGWHRDRLGGMVFAGSALDEKGVECDGRFAVFGPVVYFGSDTGDTAGIAVTRLGSSLVSVFTDLDDTAGAGVRTVVSGGAATVPVDLTSGDALKIAGSKASLLDHMKKGGVVMIPLGLVGLVAAGLILRKLAEIRHFHVGPDPGVREVMHLLRSGDTEGAESAAIGMGSPLSDVMRDIIGHSGSPTEYVEEVVHERILTHAHGLERHLGMIAVLGGVAPLLGLLGTVTGMIHTFRLVTIFGTGDARLLSGGISEALVTTEFGLIIAVPVLLIHAYLLRRVRAMVTQLEETAAEAIREK